GGHDFVQQGSIKHIRRFTQCAQRGTADAEALLHLRQGRGLLHAAQAGHRRVEKVQEHQCRVLVVKQLPVPGAVPLGANRMQAREERSEYAKVLETLEGLLCDGRGGGSGHAGLLVLGMLLPESTVYLPGPLPSAKFVPNSIGCRQKRGPLTRRTRGWSYEPR